MATLTNNTAFTIAAQSTAIADTTLEVIAVAAAGEGRGRLIHPTLGTFDYPYQPQQWTNLDGDVIIAPQWQNSKTLSSGQNTLWSGNIKDVECIETWTAPGGLAMPMTMLRMFLSIYQNPPDPTVDYVQWWPQYTTTLGYDVIVKSVTVGRTTITLTDISQGGYIDLPVSVTYQIVGNAS